MRSAFFKAADAAAETDYGFILPPILTAAIFLFAGRSRKENRPLYTHTIEIRPQFQASLQFVSVGKLLPQA